MGSFNNLRVVSNDIQLDTYSDIDISLTYQIQNIEDITVKNASYSKTVVLPGTKTNNDYFKNLYDVNIDISETNYNPKKSQPVQVLIEDVLIFQGNLQLLNIIINKKLVEYEVVLTGSYKNIINNLSDYYLDQLNLDEYNHYRNVNNIRSSWSNNIFIGDPNVIKNSSPGIGYTYPTIVNGQNPISSNGVKSFNSFDLNPAVYVKTLIDKIFEFAGYTYTSNFFQSDYFNSLVIPTETPQYSSEDLIDKLVRVTYNTEPTNLFVYSNKLDNGLQTFYSPETTLRSFSAISPMLEKSNSWWVNSTNGSWYLPLSVESGTYGGQAMQDPNNEWSNTGTTRYKCQTSGFYSIDLDNSFYVFYKHKTGESFKYVGGTIKYLSQVVKVSPNGTTTVLFQSNILTITPPGVGTTGILSGQAYTIPGSGFIPSGFLASNNPSVANLNVSSVWLNAGEEIRVRFQVLYDGNVKWGTLFDLVLIGLVSRRTVSDNINRLEIKPSVTANYSVNSLIKLSDMLPKMKMRDFFINISKMFNLIITDNPNIDNDLLVEPRDDFFNSKRKVNDWSDKVDYDQDIKQIPMSELDTKSYYFTYTPDKDFYNESYTQKTDKIYGDFNIDFLNDFSNETRELKLDFSPTPVTDNLVTPMVVPFFTDIDTNNSLKPLKVKPRILFVKQISFDVVQSQNGLTTGKFYVIKDTPNSIGQVFYNYMYSGMYDDPFDPLYSLEFGSSSVLYYNTDLCCPQNNLVNQFYISTLNDITDVNSKLLEAYFHLTPSDINQFDFRDIILIDNAYWRVNSIVDYNPNAIDRTTKVVLYKLNYLDIFYNNNKELTISQNSCPTDIVVKKSGKLGNVFVSESNAPITQDCCNMWGGLWQNGFCVSTKPIINNPGGGLPNADPRQKSLVPINQTTAGSIFLERPDSLLKNRNIINSDMVIVKGENNFIGEGSSNSIILGNNSSLLSGVKNALVIGDNVSQAKDNSITVGNLQISEDGTIINLNTIIDGGFNTVMYEGKTNYIDILDGTFNSVRNLGGDSKLRPIISGSNPDID